MEGVGSIKLLYPIALFVILRNCIEFKRYVIYNKGLLGILITILVYNIFLSVLGSNFNGLRSDAVAFVELFIVPFLFINIFKRVEFRNSDLLIKSLGSICIVSSVISVASIVSPSINRAIRGLIVYENDNYWVVNNIRGFGLSSGLFFDYGIILSVIIVLYFIRGKKNILFYTFLPLMFVSIMFNARTGLITLFVGLIIALISKSKGKWVMILGCIILSLYLLKILFPLLGVSDESAKWIADFFDEILIIVSTGDLAQGNTAGTLMGNMVVLPQNLGSWIFGTGKSIYLANTHNSDVGFFIQLNYGGLIYCFLMLLLVLYVFRKTLLFSKPFAYVFFLTFLIANYKGQFLLNSGAFRLFVLLALFYNQSKQPLINKNTVVSVNGNNQ